MASLHKRLPGALNTGNDVTVSRLLRAWREDFDLQPLYVLSDYLMENGIEPTEVMASLVLDREWSKDRNPAAHESLREYLRSMKVDPELGVGEALRDIEQTIRRENMEEVTGEQGNLEHEPMVIQPMSMTEPDGEHIEVVVDGGVLGQALVTVYIPGGRSASSTQITTIKHRTDRGDPSAPPGSYARDPVWRTMDWERTGEGFDLGRRRGEPFLFPINEAAVVREAIKRAIRSAEPVLGLEGEMLYPDGQPHNVWLYMEYPPEYLQRELEREFPDSDFLTLFTDGGGYQSAPDEAFVALGEESDVLYQLVRQGAHAAETECPYAQGEDGPQDCELEHTYYGENPGRSCRFCEADIGDPHEPLYVGEGGEYVYARVPDDNVPEPEDDEPGFLVGERVRTIMGVRRSGVVARRFFWRESTDGTYSDPPIEYVPVEWDDGTRGYESPKHIEPEDDE